MGTAIAATARARATVGGTLRTSNLVRSAHAAYETFCKLESEYPLAALATPPLHKSMNPLTSTRVLFTTSSGLQAHQNRTHNFFNAYLAIPTSGPVRARGLPRPVAS